MSRSLEDLEIRVSRLERTNARLRLASLVGLALGLTLFAAPKAVGKARVIEAAGFVFLDQAGVKRALLGSDEHGRFGLHLYGDGTGSYQARAAFAILARGRGQPILEINDGGGGRIGVSSVQGRASVELWSRDSRAEFLVSSELGQDPVASAALFLRADQDHSTFLSVGSRSPSELILHSTATPRISLERTEPGATSAQQVTEVWKAP